jgi:hypothetical protein
MQSRELHARNCSRTLYSRRRRAIQASARRWAAPGSLGLTRRTIKSVSDPSAAPKFKGGPTARHSERRCQPRNYSMRQRDAAARSKGGKLDKAHQRIFNLSFRNNGDVVADASLRKTSRLSRAHNRGITRSTVSRSAKVIAKIARETSPSSYAIVRRFYSRTTCSRSG